MHKLLKKQSSEYIWWHFLYENLKICARHYNGNISIDGRIWREVWCSELKDTTCRTSWSFYVWIRKRNERKVKILNLHLKSNLKLCGLHFVANLLLLGLLLLFFSICTLMAFICVLILSVLILEIQIVPDEIDTVHYHIEITRYTINQDVQTSTSCQVELQYRNGYSI